MHPSQEARDVVKREILWCARLNYRHLSNENARKFIDIWSSALLHVHIPVARVRGRGVRPRPGGGVVSYFRVGSLPAYSKMQRNFDHFFRTWLSFSSWPMSTDHRSWPLPMIEPSARTWALLVPQLITLRAI
jgi:hypothetical protein